MNNIVDDPSDHPTASTVQTNPVLGKDSIAEKKSMASNVRLDAFLKYVGAVGTGGEAKVRIQGGEVSVNDEIETRRRKQLFAGDRVTLADTVHVVPEGELSDGP